MPPVLPPKTPPMRPKKPKPPLPPLPPRGGVRAPQADEEDDDRSRSPARLEHERLQDEALRAWIREQMTPEQLALHKTRVAESEQEAAQYTLRRGEFERQNEELIAQGKAPWPVPPAPLNVVEAIASSAAVHAHATTAPKAQPAGLTPLRGLYEPAVASSTPRRAQSAGPPSGAKAWLDKPRSAAGSVTGSLPSSRSGGGNGPIPNLLPKTFKAPPLESVPAMSLATTRSDERNSTQGETPEVVLPKITSSFNKKNPSECVGTRPREVDVPPTVLDAGRYTCVRPVPAAPLVSASALPTPDDRMEQAARPVKSFVMGAAEAAPTTDMNAWRASRVAIALQPGVTIDHINHVRGDIHEVVRSVDRGVNVVLGNPEDGTSSAVIDGAAGASEDNVSSAVIDGAADAPDQDVNPGATDAEFEVDYGGEE